MRKSRYQANDGISAFSSLFLPYCETRFFSILGLLLSPLGHLFSFCFIFLFILSFQPYHLLFVMIVPVINSAYSLLPYYFIYHQLIIILTFNLFLYIYPCVYLYLLIYLSIYICLYVCVFLTYDA